MWSGAPPVECDLHSCRKYLPELRRADLIYSFYFSLLVLNLKSFKYDCLSIKIITQSFQISKNEFLLQAKACLNFNVE